MFRSLSPSINETGLYDKATDSFDVPYFLLAAAVHGAMAVLPTWPCAVRALYPEGRPVWEEGRNLGEMCGVAVSRFLMKR